MVPVEEQLEGELAPGCCEQCVLLPPLAWGPSFSSPNKAEIPQTFGNFQTAELEGEGRWIALSP